MKTIAFYSYKGGMGKTLAASNLAAFLSKMGKNCVLLDMDFEGPSLHHKFIEGESSIGPLGGFLGYLSKHIISPLWPYDNVRDFDLHIPASELTGFVKEIRIRKTQEDMRTGRIHFIPAGDPFNDTFWETALSPTFKKMFRLFLEYSYTLKKLEALEDKQEELKDKAMETDEVLKMIDAIKKQQLLCGKEITSAHDFLLSVKNRIANLEPKPDYLIIDLRAGAFEMSSALLGTWADTAICMFTLNRDNIRYVTNVLFQADEKRQAIKEVSNKVDSENDTELNRQINIIPVLCRVPTGFEYRYDKDLHELLNSLGKKNDELCILHSDRDLEVYESIRLGLNSKPQNVRLSHDYVRLFYEIIKDDGIVDAPHWKAGCRMLSNMIGLPADLDEQDRIFLLETNRGALINPNDGSRNVSFKVDTFQRLLLGIEEELNDPKTFNILLNSAGKKCGSRFGETLVNKWATEMDSVLKIDQVRLQKWCEFDSDVGFGKFDLKLPILFDKEGFFEQADIILRESFLTPSTDTVLNEKIFGNKHILCSFMTGYIKGVLNFIIDVDIEVEHYHETQTEVEGFISWTDARSESCVFRIRRIRNNNVNDLGGKQHE